MLLVALGSAFVREERSTKAHNYGSSMTVITVSQGAGVRSWIQLESVHGSPSNDLLPWYSHKRRNLVNSV